MNKVPAKIYYLINTGEILTITSECQGDVSVTSKEEDMEIYEQLKDKNIDEIDFIELEYGTVATTFNNLKSYSIDVVNKKLECVYLTQEEIDAMQQQNQEVQALNSRVSDISTYLSNSDETTIANIEFSILAIEKNKIINGGV